MATHTPKRLLVMVVVALLLHALAASCSAPRPGGESLAEMKGVQSNVPIEMIVAQSNIQRNTSPSVLPAALSELSAGNTEFAFDLYQAVRDGDGNLFYSPLSISMALAMVYAGARGETEQQMADTLHFTLPQDQLHPALNAIELGLTQSTDDATKEQEFELNIANSIWGQAGYSFLPEYLDLLAQNYGTGLRLLDFANESGREQGRLTINNWVSDHTKGRIEDLLAPGALTENTRLVLANAIYFEAGWETPFDSWDTTDAPFYLLSGEQVTVTMMYRSRTWTSHARDTGYEALELPYRGNRVRMTIFLPAEGQFEEFERSLDSELVNSILQALTRDDVVLYMPRFEYDASLSLAETLMEMGMSDALNPDQADFSGMDGTRNFFITDAVHKAFVTVDEIGTIAAAATVVSFVEVCGGDPPIPTVVRIDRPFIFIIRDVESNTILFVGRVVDPTAP